jgi:hypothetical protein
MNDFGSSDSTHVSDPCLSPENYGQDLMSDYGSDNNDDGEIFVQGNYKMYLNKMKYFTPT